MEWWAWFYEFKAKQLLKNVVSIPGKKYDRVEFDLKRSINWDLKASAIRSDNHKIILNDQQAMEMSVKEFERHGEIIALCDVKYNDKDRSFQRWHEKLKGGKSKYQQVREQRTAVSRYRKTEAVLIEILFVIFNASDLNNLLIMKQGRNSNGQPRPPKYMLDLERLDLFEYCRMEL